MAVKHTNKIIQLSIDDQLKITEIDAEIKEHNDWFKTNHNIVVVGYRKFLDLTTMTSITLPAGNRCTRKF